MEITIKKGTHTSPNFGRLFLKAVPLPYCYLKRRVVSVVGSIDTPIEDWEPFSGDPDVKDDLNKFFGVYRSFGKNANNDSVMLSFRPRFEQLQWEIRPYANIEAKIYHGWESSQPDKTVLVDSGQKFRADFYLSGPFAMGVTVKVFNHIDPHNPVYAGYNMFDFPEKANSYGLVGPWIGGKDDDGNNLGGPAPADIRLSLSWKIRKTP